MRLPFQPDPYQEQVDMERRQMEFGREQTAMQVAEGMDASQVALQQVAEREDLLRWQQDLHDELQQLLHDLRNEIYDGENDKWIPQGDPIMNNKGIRKIESSIRPFLSRNMFNTNFSEERVLNILKMSSNNLLLDLAMHHKEYDLEFENCHMVLRWVKNVIMAGPHRAMNGWNKRLDSTISKRVETFSEGPQMQPKKKLFGIFR